MGKKFEVLAVEGQSTLYGIQGNLYNNLVSALDQADFNEFKNKLEQFNNRIFQTRPDQLREFIINFNKLKVKITANGRSVELSPLQLAVKSGNIELVKFLFESNDNTECSLLETRLSLLQDKLKVTAHNKDVDRSQVEIDKVTYVQDSTALHIAVALGHMDVVRYLLAYDAINSDIINIPDINGNTPLHFAACLTDEWKIFDFLIEKGANREAKNNQGLNVEYHNLYSLNVTEQMRKSFSAHINPNANKGGGQGSGGQLKDKGNVVSSPLAQALNDIFEANEQVSAKIRSVDTQINERIKCANVKYYLEQLEINIQLLGPSLQHAQTHCALTDTNRSAAIKKIIEQTNHIVKQATALVATPNVSDATNFLILINDYIDTMKTHAYAIGDYTTTKKVLFWIGILALAIVCAATGIGLAAEIGGLGFVGGYGAAANAAFSGGALATTGSAAAMADGVATATAVIASAIPLACGYLWHRHKTTGIRVIENISENAAALVKCTNHKC